MCNPRGCGFSAVLVKMGYLFSIGHFGHKWSMDFALILNSVKILLMLFLEALFSSSLWIIPSAKALYTLFIELIDVTKWYKGRLGDLE